MITDDFLNATTDFNLLVAARFARGPRAFPLASHAQAECCRHGGRKIPHQEKRSAAGQHQAQWQRGAICRATTCAHAHKLGGSVLFLARDPGFR